MKTLKRRAADNTSGTDRHDLWTAGSVDVSDGHLSLHTHTHTVKTATLIHLKQQKKHCGKIHAHAAESRQRLTVKGRKDFHVKKKKIKQIDVKRKFMHNLQGK